MYHSDFFISLSPVCLPPAAGSSDTFASKQYMEKTQNSTCIHVTYLLNNSSQFS